MPDDYRVSAETESDLEIVLRLLKEQVTRVQDLSRSIEVYQIEFGTSAILLGICFFVLLYGGAIISTVQSPYAGPAFLVSMLIIVVVLGIILFRAWRLTTIAQEDRRIAATRLSRLIQAASQLNDHSHLSFGRRLEMDIALAEAEAVYRHRSGPGSGRSQAAPQ